MDEGGWTIERGNIPLRDLRGCPRNDKVLSLLYKERRE